MNVVDASAIFQVSDLGRAIDFYVNTLGFKEDFIYGEPPYYAAVRRQAIAIHFCSGKENRKRIGMGSIFICADEVDEYYSLLKSRGVYITSELATWPYGMRDFQIKDIDGNHLCFGCSIKSEVKEM